MKISRIWKFKFLLIALLLCLHSSIASGMEQEEHSVYTHSHKTSDGVVKPPKVGPILAS